jgi:predicted Fe-Mo cluster-binding NifX family protein
MRLCIPTLDGRGLEGEVAAHFGSAPYFTLVDDSTDQIEVLQNRGHHHAHGACTPAAPLAGRGVEAVACSGLGRRALAQLEDAGFRVFQAAGPQVADVLRTWKAGGLRPMTLEAACAGHGGGCGGGPHRHRHGPHETHGHSGGRS